MLTLNGKQYAQNKAEFEAGGAHGYYKVKRGKSRVAILIMDAAKEPKALISPDCAIVTAYRFEGDGKNRYMYATTKETEEFLGIGGMSYRESRQIAQAAISSVGVTA